MIELRRVYEAGVGRHTAVAEGDSWRVEGIDDGLRRYIAIEGETPEGVTAAFLSVYGALKDLPGGEGEPMMNILAVHGSAGWRLMVFPRTRHRPSFFFAEGEEKILLSPAAVDCGGVLTTPVEKDFRKLTASLVAQMFDEVMFPPAGFAQILAALRSLPTGRAGTAPPSS